MNLRRITPKCIDKRLNNCDDDELVFESLVIYYWYTSIYFSMDEKENTLLFSEKTLTIINSSKNVKTSVIEEEGIKSISKQMNHIKSIYI
ncbi:MAG: hypothetical protein HRT40_00570 [Campylobacteraceae bacterium]|nr:hypothetical protein [Campylobacteraceae bacterium]